MMTTIVRACAMVAVATSLAGTAGAQEPEWTGRVLKVGEERAAVQALPITERPNRPLHFYGNTVRRRHHRGTALPTPRDLTAGASALINER